MNSRPRFILVEDHRRPTTDRREVRNHRRRGVVQTRAISPGPNSISSIKRRRIITPETCEGDIPYDYGQQHCGPKRYSEGRMKGREG